MSKFDSERFLCFAINCINVQAFCKFLHECTACIDEWLACILMQHEGMLLL